VFPVTKEMNFCM